MKNTEKLMILISVVLVSLLAIGAVSAANADTTVIGDDIEAEHTVEPTTEEPVAEPEPIEKPEVTEPTGTFQKLDDEIVAGQINHEGNVTLDKDYQNTDGHGITIKKETDKDGNNYTKVNLDGQNHIIDGNYNQTIFTIEKDMTVVMKNLIFINGNDDFGGAIYNEGDLTLINVTFMSNWAEEMGGAIYNDGKLTMVNTTFIGNGVGGDDAIYGFGGAIYNSADDEEFLTITNATFIENTAIYGGAIYNAGLGLFVESVGFFDNFADEDGGAIYNDEDFITAIDTVVFDGNGADGSGGAIYTEGSFLGFLDIDAINHAWFTNNYAGECGGAIYTGATLAELNDTWFYNNTVIAPSSYQGTPAGGAIYGENLVLAIANSTFEENIATDIRNAVGIGGAIFAKSVAIEDSGFEDNFAALEGGAIEANTVDLDNVIFLDNEAKYGGALFIANGIDSYIIDSFFAGNTAEENGGAIFFEAEAASEEEYAVIKQSEFMYNEAIKGGAIYSAGNLVVSASNFTENGLDDCDYSYGGAIYKKSGLLKVKGPKASEPSILKNDIAAFGSEIYVEDEEDPVILGYAFIINEDGTDSINSYDNKNGHAQFFIVTEPSFFVVNNETGSVAIAISLYDLTTDYEDIDDITILYGEEVNITLFDADGNIVFENVTHTIGDVFFPELWAEDSLANGTYLLSINYAGNALFGYWESSDEDLFSVVNMTAVLEDVYEKGNATGYADGYIKGNATGYADGYNKGNATGYINGYNTAESIANVTIENLNNTNKNLTAENTKLKGDLANKTTEAANLQSQVNTLNSQLTSAQTANTETNAKIKKVSAKSKVKKSKNFKITVKLSSTKVNGKYVYVIFNGKSYKAKTKNGIAKITIKKSALKKLGGKKIKYQIIYNQNLKNKTVKIKK